MVSGDPPKLGAARGCAMLGLVMLSSATALAAPSPGSVEALMAQLASTRRLQASYEETKTLAVLKRPLRSSGQLIYRRAPVALARVVESPKPARVVITPVELATYRPKLPPERLSLRERPEVQALVGSLLALLQGDLARLREAYGVSFAVSETGWSLVLTPKGKRLSALVRKLSFEGVGRELRVLSIEEASGDRTVTQVSSIRFDPRPTSEDDQVFEAP